MGERSWTICVICAETEPGALRYRTEKLTIRHDDGRLLWAGICVGCAREIIEQHEDHVAAPQAEYDSWNRRAKEPPHA